MSQIYPHLGEDGIKIAPPEDIFDNLLGKLVEFGACLPIM